MTHHGRSRRAGSLALCVAGILVSVVLTACATQTSSQTVTPVMPTKTPVPLSPTQAWGNYAATHITLPLATTSHFTPTDISPDGSTIVGVSTRGGQMQVMLLEVATGHTRVLYTAPPDLGTPLQVQTDGRFVAWAGGNEGEGSRSDHNVVGYSDLQTGKVTMVADNNQHVRIVGVTHGTMVLKPDSTNPQLPPYTATDLANNLTLMLPISQLWNCSSVSWPYLLCTMTNGIPYWKLYNLATNVLLTLTSIVRFTQDMSGYMVALAGTAIFLLPPGGSSSAKPAQPAQLAEIDLSDLDARPSGTVRRLGSAFVASNLMANGRLVVWSGNGDGGATNTLYAWDRAQNRLVAFDSLQSGNFVVRDHVAMIIRGSSSGAGDITIINTDTLPKAAVA